MENEKGIKIRETMIIKTITKLKKLKIKKIKRKKFKRRKKNKILIKNKNE